MKYLLDTNIVLIYLRDKKTKAYIDENYAPFSTSNIPILSVVTLGEIESIAIRNDWGQKRINAVEQFFQQCIITDINAKDVISKYGEIDAYSQGKLKHKTLGLTARNMGKNDLWIAASAIVTKATLITTDKDFAHLNESYLELALIEMMK